MQDDHRRPAAAQPRLPARRLLQEGLLTAPHPPGGRRAATLAIAGVSFRVRNASPRPLAPFVAGYAGFVSPRGPRAPARLVEVAMREASPEEPAGDAVPVAEAADSWSLHRDGGGLLFRMRGRGRRGARRTLWSARWDPRASAADLRTRETLPGPHGRQLLNCLQYPLDQLLLLHALGDRGLIVHGGAAVQRGRALVYAGVSGAGKTTLSRLLDAAGLRVLSDDRIVLSAGAGGMRAWGSPWPGEGGFARNESAPLAGLLFLAQAARTELLPLDTPEALARLLPTLSVPWYEGAALTGPLRFAGELLAATPSRLLRFAPGPEAARLLRAHLVRSR